MASKFKGLNAHRKRLKALASPAMTREIEKALFAGGQLIESEAKSSITRGSVSGKGHKPSTPGTPPSNDTGVLKNNIETAKHGVLKVRVTSSAPYAAIHEFGGTINHPGGTPYFMRDGKPVFVSNSGAGAFHGLPKTKAHTITMPSRPYMRPARDKQRPAVKALVEDAINRIVKRSRSSD